MQQEQRDLFSVWLQSGASFFHGCDKDGVHRGAQTGRPIVSTEIKIIFEVDFR